MSNPIDILIYGGNGYTGKLIAESLANRNIPFYFSGRSHDKLVEALGVVEERVGRSVEAEIIAADNDVESLLPVFSKAKVVINVVGPFMQLAWPIVEASLQANCHYLDTTGEQDWTLAIGAKYGQKFADKRLLLCPANSYMWAAGALAAEVMLENKGVDSLDILYQIDHGLPSEASTKSFLRMVCNDTAQYFLELNEFKAWAHDKKVMVAAAHRNMLLGAHPWGGGCEPVWYFNDDRVKNCRVLTAIGEHLIDNVIGAIQMFNEQARHLSQEEKEAWTNAVGSQMDSGEPPKDDIDVQRSVVICKGQGRNITKEFILNVSAPYTWTGEICAEASVRLLNNECKNMGFQSAAVAFGHRELIETFHALGFCNLPD